MQLKLLKVVKVITGTMCVDRGSATTDTNVYRTYFLFYSQVVHSKISFVNEISSIFSDPLCQQGVLYN
jgi:hypothetical protein